MSIMSVKDEEYVPYNIKIIYPNALSWGEIFGEVDEENKEWKNGVIELAVKINSEVPSSFT